MTLLEKNVELMEVYNFFFKMDYVTVFMNGRRDLQDTGGNDRARGA